MYVIYKANKNNSMEGVLSHPVCPRLLCCHLVLEFQVFDTRPEKIFCSIFLISDDCYLYTALHPLEKSPHLH